jgi:hypothetical protein
MYVFLLLQQMVRVFTTANNVARLTSTTRFCETSHLLDVERSWITLQRLGLSLHQSATQYDKPTVLLYFGHCSIDYIVRKVNFFHDFQVNDTITVYLTLNTCLLSYKN